MNLDRFIDSIPTTSEKSLGQAAAEVESKAARSISLIESARGHLQTEEIHGRIRDFKIPPTYAEVFQMPIEQDQRQRQWAVKEIEFFRELTNKYKDGEFDPVTIEQDIIKLSANLVFFSSWVNYIDSVSTHAESVRKEAEMRAFIELRNWAETQEVGSRQFGVETMRALAVEQTKDQTDFTTLVTSVSATIKGFYYALKDFIGYLDRVSQRAQMERHQARGGR